MNKLALDGIDMEDRSAYISIFSSMELLVRKLTASPGLKFLKLPAPGCVLNQISYTQYHTADFKVNEDIIATIQFKYVLFINDKENKCLKTNGYNNDHFIFTYCLTLAAVFRRRKLVSGICQGASAAWNVTFEWKQNEAKEGRWGRLVYVAKDNNV